MDPDYEVAESLRQEAKEREEKDLAQHVERIKAIVTKEFKTEIESRENQLLEIQKRLSKAAKTLHLLRYVLVSSYYNRAEVQYQQTEDELKCTDGQSRIHPAIKKILGDTGTVEDFNRRVNTRSRQAENFVIQESTDKTLKQPELEEEKEVKSKEESKEEVATVLFEEAAVRNRQMVKKRLIVGNISKWMPSENFDDNSTHKWMVYVRGTKENPSIDGFVKKVVFYLHPSYKPNDVIEITKQPFHLSRRGWGEFPLRVQICFHSELNKPVDIIHNLKLDKTHTGQQTLGNETIADINIYSSEKVSETVTIKQEKPATALDPFLDHTYSLLSADQSTSTITRDGVLLHLVKRKRPAESLLKVKKFKVDEYRINFPSHFFKSVLTALPYLLRHLPLITELAEDVDYKSSFSYTCGSLEEFKSWPYEKRQSCEWSRATRVKRILNTEYPVKSQLWTTKKIVAYARAHGFSPLTNYAMLWNSSYNDEYLFANSEVSQMIIKREIMDPDIDITNDEEEKTKGEHLEEPMLTNEFAFIKQAALDVGVLLKPEEIVEGVTYNATHRVILSAVMSLAENLIRNSRGIMAHENNFSEDSSVIGVQEVTTVLNTHRAEFKRIVNFDRDLVKY